MTRVYGFVILVLLGCDRPPPPQPSPSSSASATPGEPRCRLSAGVPIPIATELGQKIEVATGTKCVILDAAPALTRLRIIDGPHAGTVGWTQSGAVIETATK